MDENRIADLAKRAGLPPDGGPLRDVLISIIKAGLEGEELERELDEIRRDREDDEWTPEIPPDTKQSWWHQLLSCCRRQG